MSPPLAFTAKHHKKKKHLHTHPTDYPAALQHVSFKVVANFEETQGILHKKVDSSLLRKSRGSRNIVIRCYLTSTEEPSP